MPTESNGFSSVESAAGLAGFHGIRSVVCKSRSSCGTPSILHASLPRNLAVQVSYPDANSPSVYGHIWSTVLAFWYAFVRPRFELLKQNASLSPLRIFLPTGLKFKSFTDRSFEEIAALFDCAAARLEIRRVPWVPLCSLESQFRPGHHTTFCRCCWSGGKLPSELQGSEPHQLVLLTQFPGNFASKHTPTLMGAVLNRPFRADARRCLGMTGYIPLALTTAPTSVTHGNEERVVVWVLASAGSNGRRILNEQAVIKLVADILSSQAHDVWRLETVAPGKDSYVEELRRIGRGRLLVSLFGASLHNVRFLPEGSAVLEIHAALKNDFTSHSDYFYQSLCVDGLGLRWFGYAPQGFRPVVTDMQAARNASRRAELQRQGKIWWSHERYDTPPHATTYSNVRINLTDFGNYFQRVLHALGGDQRIDGELAAEYARALRTAPNPAQIKPIY